VAKVSSKRQITLPTKQCKLLGIDPGDEVEVFIADGQLTVVKKQSGAAKGVLAHIKADAKVSDEASRDSSIE
jgi:AbrB family looped-hinge helix DNA binding protein